MRTGSIRKPWELIKRDNMIWGDELPEPMMAGNLIYYPYKGFKDDRGIFKEKN